MIGRPWTIKEKVLQCPQSTNLQKHLLFVEETKTWDNKNGDMKHETHTYPNPKIYWCRIYFLKKYLSFGQISYPYFVNKAEYIYTYMKVLEG